MAFSFPSIPFPLQRCSFLSLRPFGPVISASRSFRGVRRLRHCATLTSPTPSAVASDSAAHPEATSGSRKRIVFFGTPFVAAQTLSYLWDHASAGDYEIVGAITKKPNVARNRVIRSAVHERALELGVGTVLTPSAPLAVTMFQKASEGDTKDFISSLRDLKADLFITIAYGLMLPDDVLKIPRLGTLNLHPSLLPSYRGAAPVQRALEAGERLTGFSIVRTVLDMDAGPILYAEEYELNGNERAGELMEILFKRAVRALVDRVLPSVLGSGERGGRVTGKIQEIPQCETGRAVSRAKKVTKEEGRTDFSENALRVHNKVRAFDGWPGVQCTLLSLGDNDPSKPIPIPLKLIKTEIESEESIAALGVHEITFEEEALRIVCDDGSVLRVLEVQKQGKNVISARAFWNGLRGRRLERKRVPY